MNILHLQVDFLRRHMTELKRSVETSSSTSARVSSLQETVKDLQTTLAQALYRTEMLENKTGTLKVRGEEFTIW